ncbi:MAG: choice-of-anchor D domain-containing protein [Terracidiphilus sp.]
MFTGVLTITSNSSQGNVVVNMSAAGVATTTVSKVSCSTSSITGAGSDACTVTLTAAPSSGGLSVSLASNDTAVTVPASVTVAANATSAAFTASVAAVSSSQTATLTASAGGASATVSVQLVPAVATLSANATSISFGSVAVNTPATQSVVLTSTGSVAVTVNSGSVSGSGFTVSGATFPMTLTPGQTATLDVQFDPTASGAATGQLTIGSNCAGNGTMAIPLSGTGLTYKVALSWSAPSSSSDPVAGYKIYRAPQGSSTFLVLNASIDTQTSYTDSSPQNGVNYQYYVTSVDSAGNQSVPSNEVNLSIP